MTHKNAIYWFPGEFKGKLCTAVTLYIKVTWSFPKGDRYFFIMRTSKFCRGSLFLIFWVPKPLNLFLFLWAIWNFYLFILVQYCWNIHVQQLKLIITSLLGGGTLPIHIFFLNKVIYKDSWQDRKYLWYLKLRVLALIVFFFKNKVIYKENWQDQKYLWYLKLKSFDSEIEWLL